jgi:O-acetyl-ADP-ribose deacetylase (regulator of RNase III)
MIELAKGNLLEADVQALVNTVNTVGVMGKGIALQFRETFPENYKFYQKACQHGEVEIGKMLVYDSGRFVNPRYIINFPTKRHWREPARIEDIAAGLPDLVHVIRELGIESAAVPPLGCGSGGLDWNKVRPLIMQHLNNLPDVKVFLYEPAGAPKAESIRVQTTRPNMTLGRAALIYLVNHYALPSYRLSLLEIQKLMYFMQQAGEPLRLAYEKKQFGPYAENLNHVLQRLEGHYLRGYGDRSTKAGIGLVSGAYEEAEQFLHQYPETMQRLERVTELIEGFETPYGMELLATVHWLAQQDSFVKTDPGAAIQGFENWSQRKREYFRPEHIRVAWDRLRQQHWL